MSKLLVVAAHPDDEVLGCGATVKKLVRQGYEAELVLMTGGVMGRFSEAKAQTEEQLAAQAELKKQTAKSAELLGFSNITTFDFPDNRMDTVSRMDLSQAISEVVERFQPDLLFTHHYGDYNWDHTLTFEAVMMAARANPPTPFPAEIRTFEVLSSTERAAPDPAKVFMPNLYVDVAATIDFKKQAMRTYKAEYQEYPRPRNIQGIEYLARKRGNEVGLEYCEAFQIIRKVEY